ncbi:MetQ/NlpA family ABC transporter substrate-binding protein [Ruminococcaceae bacterium OttesenSCG-928-N02]|nr:MetQ/NlpA family ABC transporter substrate-binding protein [Ruminococcaceae bacterium OttesenSCG-928-N02]
MATFLNTYGPLLYNGTLETLAMVFFSTLGSVLLGLPLGILLFTTAKGGITEKEPVHKFLGALVDTGRSIPFLILMVVMMPFTRTLVGKSIGPPAAIVPLIVAATPFVARLVESSLSEIDSGVLEASLCMGASPVQIITQVLLVEARPSLVRALAILAVTIVGYSAMGGAVGAGGLGDIAIRYGFHRRLPSVMWASVFLLMLLVWLIQGFLGFIALKIDKNRQTQTNEKGVRKMKKLAKRTAALGLALALVFSLSACGGSTPSSTSANGDEITLTVGASPSPHAGILEIAKPILAQQGITLNIVEFTDYVMPNLSLEDGSLDANFFQHQPYLDTFNDEHETSLVSIGAIHFEPMGIYPGKAATLDEIAQGTSIGIPNDRSNGARALLLLEELGYLTLAQDVGLLATVQDITENPLGLKIVELPAEQLPLSLPDVDFAIINGNHAVNAGIQSTLLASENAQSEGANTYANVLCVRAGEENNEALLALLAALQSEDVRTYISETYPDLSVIPMF